MQSNVQSDKRNYLSTGILHLDKLLSMDGLGNDPASKGLLIGKGEKRDELETPVILISGSTGTGKTTLALQIAFSAARQGMVPCFYALEQTTSSLRSLASDFGFYDDAHQVEFCDLAEVGIQHSIGKCIKPLTSKSKIHLCHLSPRPISEIENQDVFEKRLDELHHMISKVTKEIDDDSKIIVFFIDSLNAFSLAPLGRNEIYRIFSLFRTYHVPAILTMEHRQGYYGDTEFEFLETAKFLSDIAIHLSKEKPQNYLQYYLEIEKSRVGRQSLGKHLYKIRTRQSADTMKLDSRTGIVLYPSIHSTLSVTREKNISEYLQDFHLCKEGKHDDVDNIMESKTIKEGECLTIVGPPGTHKLALGMNLSMGHLEKMPPRCLIVNFGGSGDFGFKGIAWTVSNEYCGNLGKDNKYNSNYGHMKFWCTKYECPDPVKEQAYATILTFQIGQLSPEECFYIVEKVTNGNEQKFSSVLLSDTAELCSGFPMLAYDPLFLPALVDLFRERGLVTVCIGVDTKQPSINADINFALSSRADYRIVMSHYPEKPAFYEQIVRPKAGKSLFKEQLVSLVIDNVSGKHYAREPRWLRVETIEKGKTLHKILHCEKQPRINRSLPAIWCK